jgi:dinuclear metal center YbgI/SA1388 family protein
MASIAAVIARLDELLDAPDHPDLGPNGLQVPGRRDVFRVVTGVSATRALIDRAVELDADLVLVHHGLFWDFDPTGLTPVLAERLRPLFKHDVNLAAYHLPLDAHPEVGNNAQLAAAIGLAEHEPFGSYKGRPIGRKGTFGEPVPVAELLARIERATERAPLHHPGGPDPVASIGIVTGSAASSLPEAAAEGLDAFVTGEPREHSMGEAAEYGVHFVAAGHYATETFGVRRLGELLEREFGIEHHWLPLPNPV